MEGHRMADNYYKVSEVAKKFNVTPQAVYKWINEGKLRAVKVGESTRIRSDDLADFEQPIIVGQEGKK